MKELNTGEAVRRILSENPPMYFSELLEKYQELAGPLAVSARSVRRSLDQLIHMELVVRGKNYVSGKGYLYSSPETNAAPVATPTEIIYGDQVVESLVFLTTLWASNKHPTISDESWEDFRIYLMQYLLGGLEPDELRNWLENYRSKLTRHLTQVNTLINGDIFHLNKRKAIAESIPNREVLLDIINQYASKQIDSLPEV